MPKSTDTFFIRQNIQTRAANAFSQEAIDLGSFVDALGKSILRIKSISVSYGGETSQSTLVIPDVQSTFGALWQLTTQSQDDIVRTDDKSVISTGQLVMSDTANVAGAFNGVVQEQTDLNPSNWTDGYLVATDAIYLGALCRGTPFNNEYPNIGLVLECEVTTMSQSAAMALALSQQ